MKIKIGDPSFSATIIGEDRLQTEIEKVWDAAKEYARRNGYEYNDSYGVVQIAPT